MVSLYPNNAASSSLDPIRKSRQFERPNAHFTRYHGDVAYIPTGLVNQEQLTEAVAQAAKALDSRDVHDLRFRLGSDADGEPSIFFGILLSPRASNASRLAAVTGRISTALFDQLQPYNRWGLQPYFDFTTDRAHFRNPGWM